MQTRIFDWFYRYGTVITVVLLFVVFSSLSDAFLSQSNIVNILRSIAIVTIIAIGLTISLSVGGFDLSVGAIASVSVVIVMSMFVWYAQSVLVAVVVTLVIGCLLGLLNAVLILKLRIPDMLLTLATMFVIQGLALTYARGAVVNEGMIDPNGVAATGVVPDLFATFGDVPWIIIIMLVCVVSVHLFLTYTRHGRYMYMIGSNSEAAALSGIPVARYRTLAYVLSAAFASVGGMLLGARILSAEINAGAPYLMDAVAAAYIGFALFGLGRANPIGTFVGAVMIGVLQNGLVMLNVPYYTMDIVKGLVLAFALGVTYYRKRD
ncbi:MAG: ABC transporter permease [Bacilli bacterium]